MKKLLLIFVLFCLYIIQINAQSGCTDPNAHNYDATATTNDGSCETCFDGIQNGDEVDLDCGGTNPNCSTCVLDLQLDVDGDANILGKLTLGGNQVTETLIEYNGGTDGLKINYDGVFTSPSGDYLVFEKTDGNTNDPDGGIAFVNTGIDGVQEPAMIVKGNGDVEMNEIRSLNGYIDIESDNSISLDAINGSLLMSSAGSVTFRVGDSTIKMEIEPSGEVGIGTNNPSAKLHVNGSIKAVLPFGDYANMQYNTMTDEFYYDNSSRRYKENITLLNEDFLKVLEAQPVTYTRPGTPDRWEVGYIAEDMDALGLTPLVGYDDDGIPNDFRYDKMVLYLNEVNKIQQQQIEQLQQQVKQLTSKKKFRLFKKKN